jgi:F0F1-type ATP synthase assembly protein I
MVSILAALALINLVAQQPFSVGYYIVLPVFFLVASFSLSQPLRYE